MPAAPGQAAGNAGLSGAKSISAGGKMLTASPKLYFFMDEYVADLIAPATDVAPADVSVL
jgi:hypothetical protein